MCVDIWYVWCLQNDINKNCLLKNFILSGLSWSKGFYWILQLPSNMPFRVGFIGSSEWFSMFRTVKALPERPVAVPVLLRGERRHMDAAANVLSLPLESAMLPTYVAYSDATGWGPTRRHLVFGGRKSWLGAVLPRWFLCNGSQNALSQWRLQHELPCSANPLQLNAPSATWLRGMTCTGDFLEDSPYKPSNSNMIHKYITKLR